MISSFIHLCWNNIIETRTSVAIVDFIWKDDQERSFNLLKEALLTAPVLISPNYKKEFNIASDASANEWHRCRSIPIR